MRTRKEKPIFRGLTIAAVGNLGGSAQWTDANLARWVGLREGRFVRDGAGVVKAALKCPKTCHLVTLDWLEDSMLKGKRLDEEPYSHLRALKRERARERKRLMVIKGLEKAVKEVNPNLYHLYRDHTFFQYEVVMTRDNEEARIQGERYILSIFESNNAKPRLYWFVAKYYKKKGDTQAKIHRPSHAPGMFAREFALFQSFFRNKTGIPWAQRLVKTATTIKRVFQYQPPIGGKPVGWVPAEYVPTGIPNAGVVDENASTVSPASAAANTNSNGGAIPMISPIIGTSSSTPSAHHQAPSLITPAHSPRPNPATTMELVPQHGAQGQWISTSSSGTTPAFSLPTPGISPSALDLAGADNSVCAL
ncbi:hypothetical protein B0I37DRAFT_357920 [Chaetomium sp. MPI-CAGE-AT-0009]|nr:hypothetical protein B0I37DRAFT_357920 [Chaetomium sp. MPI-CAGE-AT-0009]